MIKKSKPKVEVKYKTLRINEDLHDKLKLQSVKRRLDMTTITEEAIDFFLKNYPKQQPA